MLYQYFLQIVRSVGLLCCFVSAGLLSKMHKSGGELKSLSDVKYDHGTRLAHKVSRFQTWLVEALRNEFERTFMAQNVFKVTT